LKKRKFEIRIPVGRVTSGVGSEFMMFIPFTPADSQDINFSHQMSMTMIEQFQIFSIKAIVLKEIDYFPEGKRIDGRTMGF
jgi:hypothetical protein